MFSERDFIRPDDPADEDHGEAIETHESRIDGPFALHDTCVQDHESWHRLQPDEGGSGHLPGVVARIEPCWLSGHGVRLNGGNFWEVWKWYKEQDRRCVLITECDFREAAGLYT